MNTFLHSCRKQSLILWEKPLKLNYLGRRWIIWRREMLKLDVWIYHQLSSPVVLLLVLFSSFWPSFHLQDLLGFIHTKSDTDCNKKGSISHSFSVSMAALFGQRIVCHAAAANHLSRQSDTNTPQWATGLGCSVVMSCYANFVRQSPHRSARFGRSVRFGLNAPLVSAALLLHLPFLFLRSPLFFSLYLRPPVGLRVFCVTHSPE